MGDGMHRRLTRRVAYTIGAVVGIFLVVGHGPAVAQEDDDGDTFEQKIIKGVLKGIGLDLGGVGIDYGERAPLVIPPSTDLPPPQTSAAAPPDWPKEAPRKKPKSAKKLDPNGSVRQANVDRATASPAELASGPKPTSGASPSPSEPVDNTIDTGGRPLPQSALGGSTGGLFDFNLFGNKPESARFVSEPPRQSLTQPPQGYQTPSPNYPYGIAQVKKGPTTQEMNQTTDPVAADTSSGSK
jgi:hypothetical protein